MIRDALRSMLVSQDMPAGYAAPPPPVAAAKTSGLAVTSMVLGIVGFCIGWIPVVGYVGFVTAILAVILGFVAKNQIKNSNGQIAGNGMAVTGIVLGIIQLIFVLMVVVFFAALFNEISNDLQEEAIALLSAVRV